jgi:hypothetical protein
VQLICPPVAVTTGVIVSKVTTAFAVLKQPVSGFVTTTENVPPEFTTGFCKLELKLGPVQEKFALAVFVFIVNVTESSFLLQVIAPPVAEAVGFAFTTTLTEADVAVQPIPLVTFTIYAPATLTVIDCVVAPLLHKYELLGSAVKVTEPPSQIVVFPLIATFVTTRSVSGNTTDEEAVQPFASVTKQVYVPADSPLAFELSEPELQEYE